MMFGLKSKESNIGVDIILPPIPTNVDKNPMNIELIDITKLFLLFHIILAELLLFKL